MNRELLEKPFEPDQIKQREGRDRTLDYVEGHSVIARLNEAFDGHWSFEIVRHDIFEERNEILVVGKLSADGVVKMQFGTSRIERDETTKEIVCLGDDVKAAGTDALKKCATFLGVGLHLYAERLAARSAPRDPAPRTERRLNGTGGAEHEPSGDGRKPAGQGAALAPHAVASAIAPAQAEPAAQPEPARLGGNGRLDNAQHTAILALAKKRRVSQRDLNQEALKRYGVQVPYLTYRDAADFIQKLQSA